jgi:hypothetical protein
MSEVRELIVREPVKVPSCFGCCAMLYDTQTKEYSIDGVCKECGIKPYCLKASSELVRAAMEVFP